MSIPLKVRISALIPIHNGLPHVLQCIASLKRSESRGRELRIIVIDDGSTDASESEIQSAFPDVEIISGDGNLWWTGAMEMGTRRALEGGCDYVLWLNHDDQITASSLGKLLEFVSSHPRTIGCCGVMCLGNPEGQMLLGYRVRYFSGWYLESLYSTASGHTEPAEIDVNGGHGILIPSEVFIDTRNHLRPRMFPHYFGDFDFFARVRRNGWRVIGVPGAIIQNDDGNSGILNGRRISSYKQSFSYVASRRSIANLRDRPLFAFLNFPWGVNLIWMVIFWLIPIGCAIIYPALAVLQKHRKSA